MGECLKTRRGGKKYELPVLDSAYPKDASLTVIEGNSTSATFSVVITTPGNPATYTYQWYVNGSAVSGATSSSYTKTGLTSTATYSIYCEVTNKAGTVTSRTATLSVVKYTKPVLSSSYPANVTQLEKSGGSATFKVSISTAGVPASYTYQWYVNGTAVSGATSSSYTKTGLTSTGSYTIYCKVTNAAGTVQSRTATLTVQSSQPTYTYSGSHELIKEGTYNWKIKLKTSGKLKFTHLGNCSGLDIFCVGGGGGGSAYQYANASGAGGGGGYTKTYTSFAVETGTEYTVTIGSGGSPGTSTVGSNGGTSYFYSTSYAASGGYGAGRGTSGNKTNRYYGGDGGSGGGGVGTDSSGASNPSVKGGNDGGNGGNGSFGGTGQGTTTREFGSSSGTVYAGGGAGCKVYTTDQTLTGASGGGGGLSNSIGLDGSTNTGGGGAGSGRNDSQNKAGTGGSGIVIIRNHR